jgi:hypothetical protein
MNTQISNELYSKLGLTSRLVAIAINQPDGYPALLTGLNSSVTFVKKLKEPIDFIHLFTKSRRELSIEFPSLIKFLNQSGILWVSWPKQSSNNISDLNKDIIKKIGSANGMIYQNIISVNREWSAIKFTHSNNGKEIK